MNAWQNERCFQLEPWLFHFFNIYNDEPPTVVWAVQVYLRVCVCVCLSVWVWKRAMKKDRKAEGEREREEEIDKQSENKGVA